jgi:hypothetical protein
LGGHFGALVTPVSIYFSAEEREYGGGELRSHFALDAFGIFGDSAVSFVGPCRVPLERMVDLEDVRRREAIFSPRMAHFLVEHFELPLREGVLRQRLFVRLAADLLLERGVEAIRVRGDDVYVGGRKASVSIASRSPVSTVIHVGFNVETDGVPVAAWGLAAAGIEPRDFAEDLLRRYAAEIDDILRATTKVRGVP